MQRALVFVISALVLLLGMPRAQAQVVQASEAELKAAYLYRFLAYIEWPQERLPQPTTPIEVDFVGAPDVAVQFAALARGRTAQNHPIVARAIAPAAAALGGVHVLYVGRDAIDQLPFLANAAPPGTLVVSDGEEALDDGAAVNFVPRGGRLRFAVSLPNAARAGVRIGARMLAVAVDVRKEPP